MTFEERVELAYEQHCEDILTVRFNDWAHDFEKRYLHNRFKERHIWYAIASVLGVNAYGYYQFHRVSFGNFLSSREHNEQRYERMLNWE